MPIRWDNIGGANLSEASRPLEAAQRSFLGAFDGIGGTLKQAETINANNWQNTKVNNTNSYLDQLAQFASPQDLEEARANGTLDQMRGQYGAQIDSNAVRGAADSRIEALRNSTKQAAEFTDYTKIRAQKPIEDDIRNVLYSGNIDLAKQMMVENGGLYNAPALQKEIDAFTQETVGRDRKGQLFKQDIRKGDDEHLQAGKQLKVADANIAQSYASVRASDSQVRRNDFDVTRTREQDDMARRAGVAAATKVALKDAGNMYADGIYNGSQSDEILTQMTKSGIGNNTEQRTKLIKALNDIQRKGIDITSPDGKTKYTIRDIPMSAVNAAVNASHNGISSILNPFSWNQGFATSFEDNLKDILRQQSISDGKLTNRPAEDLAAFHQAIANARQNAPGIVPNRTPRNK